ncbi:MAG: YceI family protein [Opitutae bacterium]|nr:YceI family protein [Opitutae bacterium]
MPPLRLVATLLLLPLAALAADRPLKVDRARSFIDVDVQATLHSFTGHLDRYDLSVNADESGKLKGGGLFAFKFADLRTGNPERDAAMLAWLGGGAPAGRFELGTLALTPDGQGQASGRLTFHGATHLIEFAVNVAQAEGTYTVTGEATIDYRHWGLKILRKALLVKVDPNVTVRFKLVGTLGAPVVPDTAK